MDSYLFSFLGNVTCQATPLGPPKTPSSGDKGAGECTIKALPPPPPAKQKKNKAAQPKRDPILTRSSSKELLESTV